MPTVRANDIELAYELHGAAKDPVLVLIQGLGMPLSAWPPEFIERLAGQGFRLLLFDNRDIGQSQKMDGRTPNVVWPLIKRQFGLRLNVPYGLMDMMLDTDQLMQALDIDSAHIVGISMGGMIAQLLAIHRPSRVTSLVSLMSTTGNRRLPGPRRKITRHMLSRPASDKPEDRMAYGMKTWRLIGSPAYPPSDEDLKATLERIFTRGSPPAGIARQLLAVLAADNRYDALHLVNTPSLVIHGDADPLVPLAAGIETARAIPGARLETIPGMGHDLPAQLLDKLTGLISHHARQAC